MAKRFIKAALGKAQAHRGDADRASHRFAISPPWHKAVWNDPASDSTK